MSECQKKKLLWQFGEESASNLNDALKWIDAVWLSGTAKDGAGIEMMVSVSSAEDKSARVAAFAKLSIMSLIFLSEVLFFPRRVVVFMGHECMPTGRSNISKDESNRYKDF